MTVPTPRTDLDLGRATNERLDIIESQLGTPARLNNMGRGPTAERDFYYAPPTTLAQRVALANRRPIWFNTDMGWEEQYFAVSGSAGLTVPGVAVNAPAAWYPVTGGPSGKLSTAGPQLRVSNDYFTNWLNFGAANTEGESWRSHTLIDRPTPSDLATIRTHLPGRYDLDIEMYFPNGSGTGVWSFGYLDGVASSYASTQPAVLLSGYGQIGRSHFRNVLLFDTGRCYMLTNSASWTIGNAATWMSMKYVGPPLASA